jgi:hypothetical protein
LGAKKFFKSGNEVLRLNYPVGIDSSPETYRRGLIDILSRIKDSSSDEDEKKKAEEDEGFSDTNPDEEYNSNLKEKGPKRKTQKKKKVSHSNEEGSDSENEARSRNPHKFVMENWLGAWAAQCQTIQQYVKRTTRRKQKK